MGDENHIRTLGDYSKPSHEGYRNTIELPVGNNVDLDLYDNESWNDPRDFAKPVKEIALPQDVPSTSDHRLIELKNQVQRLMEAHLAPTQPTQVNKITTSCEICSGPYDTQYCMEDPEQAFVEYASSRTDEAGGLVSNFMASQDARLFKFEAAFKQQQSEMTTKIDTVLKAIIDRIASTLLSDMEDSDVMFIKIVPKDDNSRKEEPEAGEQEFHIDPRLSQVVLGKPFVEISNMTHDPPEGVVRFINGTDEVSYKMPHKIEQYNSLSDLEKEHTKSVYLRNEEDKRRGVELYLMRRSLEVIRKFHWKILGG
ncbi:hypothetical protein Tco_0834850 [Tanacetum coccineum]